MSRKPIPTFSVDPPPEPAPIPPGATLIDMEECEDIALTAMQGLLASGAYKDPGAAAVAAWREVVPAFLAERRNFPVFLTSIYGAPQAPSEGDGETGV